MKYLNKVKETYPDAVFISCIAGVEEYSSAYWGLKITAWENAYGVCIEERPAN